MADPPLSTGLQDSQDSQDSSSPPVNPGNPGILSNKRARRPHWTDWLGPWKGPYRLAWFAVLALALVNVWFGPLNQDEGWYLLAAQNVSRGMTPYRDFLYTQGPVLPYAYGWIAGAWSDVGVLGGRLVTAVFGFLATVFFSLVAGELARRRNPDAFGPAFLLAFVLLGLSPDWAYFTAIPKTYALGSFLLALGFALSLGAPGVPNRRGSAIRSASPPSRSGSRSSSSPAATARAASTGSGSPSAAPPRSRSPTRRSSPSAPTISSSPRPTTRPAPPRRSASGSSSAPASSASSRRAIPP